MSTLVDTHCHLDLYPDPDAIVRSAVEQSVEVIAVTNTPSVFHFTRDIANTQPHIHAALGLHPELVLSRGHERTIFWDLLPETRFVGEIGLDYQTRDEDSRNKQKELFQDILSKCADTRDKVLTIHSRRAAREVVNVIGKDFPGSIILHWFSGTPRQLQLGVDHGYYFSVNPAMVRSTKGQDLIKRIPKERLLTETDGPFVEIGGEKATPAHIKLVISYLARIWDCPESDASDQVLANFRAACTQASTQTKTKPC